MTTTKLGGGLDIQVPVAYSWNMPYSTVEKKRAHNDGYYKEWYRKNGRKRSVDYAEAIAEWKKNHPEAVKAKRQFWWAVRTGAVSKPLSCQVCGRETRLSGHHADYRQPLVVLWVCSSCHKKVHSHRIEA